MFVNNRAKRQLGVPPLGTRAGSFSLAANCTSERKSMQVLRSNADPYLEIKA